MEGQKMPKYLFLDTETDAIRNDGDFNKQLVIELCYLVTDEDFNVLEEKTTMICDLAKELGKYQTVYTMDDVKTGETWEAAFNDFYRVMEKVHSNEGLIIAHNMKFDANAIGYSLRKGGAPEDLIRRYSLIMKQRGFCNMMATVDYCKLQPARYGKYKWPKLQELYNRLYPMEPFVQTHRAMDDVHMMVKCFVKCVRKGIIKV